LFSIAAQVPKLDVAGSSPVSRSIKSVAYKHPEISLLQDTQVDRNSLFDGVEPPRSGVPVTGACRRSGFQRSGSLAKLFWRAPTPGNAPNCEACTHLSRRMRNR
jgi:hypothetical protein